MNAVLKENPDLRRQAQEPKEPTDRLDLSTLTKEVEGDEWSWLEEAAAQDSERLVIESSDEFCDDTTPTDTAKLKILKEAMQLTEGLESLGYKVLQPLGVGSESTVLLAMHVDTADVRAVKFPHTKRYEEDSAAMSWLFRKEADSLKVLDHPNIVKVYDYQIHQGRPYIFLEPLDLLFIDSFEKQPTLDSLVKFMKQSADAVGHMHERGKVHLDIKPTQFMLDDDGNTVLIDLGSVRDHGASVTEGLPEGIEPDKLIQMTVGYFLPPIVQNKRLYWHWRTDIYALAKTYASFALLTAGVRYKDAQKAVRDGTEMDAVAALRENLPDVMGKQATQYFIEQIFARGMRPLEGEYEFSAEVLKNNIVELSEAYLKPFLDEKKKKGLIERLKFW